VLPGTVRGTVIPIIEETSGKRFGKDLGLAVNPEFLRESTAIKDYAEPPMTVIGEFDEASGDLLASIYEDLPAPIIRKSIEVAEMVKYSCNVWHATKISFANEIGNIAKACGVDGREVMEVVCQDSKLNLSEYYMRPGFAFGGSCLPKDVRALSYRATQLDVEIPLLKSLMQTNQGQIKKAFDLVESFGLKKIGLLGLSFKAKTDDLRESPLVELAEMLLGKGYELSIYDKNVEYARVHGANRDYINGKIPHISSLLKPEIDDVIDDSEVLVLGLRDKSFEKFVNGSRADRKVVDLVGFMPELSDEDMQGICW
jgi:GDP-mannose 6-dehydrogenase